VERALLRGLFTFPIFVMYLAKDESQAQ
jgi:hypothetical protein